MSVSSMGVAQEIFDDSCDAHEKLHVELHVKSTMNLSGIVN